MNSWYRPEFGYAGCVATVVREARTLKHQVVRRQVECLLDQLSVGDQVPSERDLATRFDVARETVRQAYYVMARKYHPDANAGEDATVMMQKINAAYELVVRNMS